MSISHGVVILASEPDAMLRKWLYLIWLFFTTFCLTEDVWEKNNNKLCDINKTYNFQWRLQKYHIYLWTINGLSKFTIQSRAEAFVFVGVSNQDTSLNETCFYIFRNQQILQNNISDKICIFLHLFWIHFWISF